jgi:SM-20-related protein
MFVRRAFLDLPMCEQLRAEMQQTPHDRAPVYRENGYGVDEHARRTKLANASTPTRRLVKERLLDLRPEVERHFNLPLTDCQTPQFLIYGVGDFFEPHQDVNDSQDNPQNIKDRRVSVVIFLNSESVKPGPGFYGGGELVFYRLLKDPRCRGLGFPLIGEAGLLIAFLPNTFHEVQRVIHGERHTIVTWFF